MRNTVSQRYAINYNDSQLLLYRYLSTQNVGNQKHVSDIFFLDKELDEQSMFLHWIEWEVQK